MWNVTSLDDVILTSLDDITQCDISSGFFEVAALPTECDTNSGYGTFRGNKKGWRTHVNVQFLTDHGRVRISTCSLVNCTGVV